MINNKTILIVEDEQYILQALSDKLSAEGFQIIEARNGIEGIKKALKEHPDLILLDIALPAIDGITIMKRLRKDKWGSRIPIIVLTNSSDIEKISEAIESDVFEYLIKSDWKIGDIAEKIKKKLEII